MKRPNLTGRIDLVVAAAVACFFLAAPAPGWGVVKGSKHDFTGTNGATLDKGGECTPCHSPHYAPDTPGLWSRSLTDERAYFDQTAPKTPEYRPTPTLLCYDCHDDMVTITDRQPPAATWSSNQAPQDIAMGGASVGYYETACGQKPAAGNLPAAGAPTGGHYWKSEPGLTPNYAQGDKIACTLCHDPHNKLTDKNDAFFRISTWRGDGTEPLDAYGTDLRKSKNSRVPTGPDNRGTGREMCATCHGYTLTGAQKTLFSVQVPKPPAGVPEHLEASATACTDCHGHNLIAGCNECHGYPPMLTVAEGGGVFDPTHPTRRYVENYAGGAGAHRRHRDALAALGSTIFDCSICHGPNPGRSGTAWHNEGCTTFAAANVDIIGQVVYWGPSGGATPPGYNGTTAGGFTGADGLDYAFKAKGGGDQRCANLICHGRPPDTVGALNWTNKMIDDTPGAFPNGDWYGATAADKLDASRICKWCHDATPARIGTGPTAPWAPDVLGADNGATGVWTTGTWGADVSGHGKAAGTYDADALNDGLGKAAANRSCTVCHDARYTTLPIPPFPLAYTPNTPIRTHLDGLYETSATEKRLRDNVNGVAVTQSTPAAAADAVCGTCHQAAGPGTEVATHQNAPLNGYSPIEAQFSRTCRQCHNVHGSNWNGATRNLRMVGRWVDSSSVGTRGLEEAGEEARVDSSDATATPPTNITAADLRVTFTANTGAGSYDAGNNEGFNPPRSVCVVCHVTLVNGHSQVGDNVPRGAGHMPVGTDCMLCHGHDKGFQPSGCFACHGTSDTEAPVGVENVDWFRRQYWPDGNPALHASKPEYDYADNQRGAHLKHVTSLAAQLFGETPLQLVTDYTAQNPSLTSKDKQTEVCWACHYNPGSVDPAGQAHSLNDTVRAGGVDRADVLQGAGVRDYLGRYTTAALANRVFLGRTKYSRSSAPAEAAIISGGDTTGGAYAFGALASGGTCANLVCHNQTATPVGWNAPPDWSVAINPDCSNTTCHATGTYTNAHAVHVDTAQKNYACTECHANNFAPVNLGHGNGSVDMVFDVTVGIAPPPVEAAAGTGNGFYDKDATAAKSAGDTGFGYKTGAYTVTCNLVYCHGGDNAAWGGGDTTPVWDNSAPDSVYCGSCHDGNGTAAPNGDSSVIAGGNHTDHLTAANGPRFADPAGIGPGTMAASCIGTATVGCHPNFTMTTATHVNGTIEFANVDLTVTGLPATDRCNRCHSTASVTVNVPGPATATGSGAALAKTNWATGTYTLPCLTCHNGSAAATVFANGTGAVTAPDMLGDDTNFGAEVRGHNRSLADGAYPVSNNVAAAKDCSSCHDAAATHINNASDTTYAGNRMLATVNGLPATTATEACNDCHAVTAGTPAVKHSINMHGNTNYAGRLEGLFPTTGNYAMECSYCHEPHGKTANGSGYNIYMVPSTITVPTPSAIRTAPGVRFEARSGNYSFNDRQGTDSDDLCEVCHSATGNNLTWNTIQSGYHESPNYLDQDRLGDDCSLCHVHNRDNSVATVDGLMPVPCNACHTYPAQVSAGVHALSPPHDKHVGRPSDQAAIPNKGFICNTCHYQSSHNDRNLNVGDAWAGVTDAMVQVRFVNPAAVPAPPQSAGPWNPAAWAGTDTVDRTKDSPSYSAGKVCSNLYCHGDDPALFPAADAGTNTKPTWVVGGAPCGSCHKYTAAAPPGDKAHPKHAGNLAGQSAIPCQVCHYDTTTDGTSIVSMGKHVNHSSEVAFSALADLRVDGTSAYAGDAAVMSGYGACNSTYCHSNGTNLTSPYNAAGTAPEQALAWDDATGSTCWSCHGDATASSPRPKYVDGTPKANKHAIHNGTDPDPLTSRNTNGYGCQVCHYPTTHDNGSTIFAAVQHVNRVYNVAPEATSPALQYFGTYTYGSPGGTCAAANCHAAGGIETVSWNAAGPIACDSCHARVAGSPAASDVNNFAWDNTTQSKINSAEYSAATTGGHGRSGANKTCGECHDSNVGHDRTMTGPNLYRLSNGFTCSSTASACHAAGTTGPATGLDISTFVTHSSTAMGLSGYTTKRSWPGWDPQCVNCHDPHGDGANRSMIQKELYDKAAYNLNAAAPANPTEQTNLAFTDDTTGVGAGSYAWSTEASPNYSGVCQECHEDASMVSFHDGPSGGTTFGANHPNVGTTDCSDCHRHNSGLAPTGCESCHDYDGPGPNVMGPGTNYDGVGSTPKPYDDGAWGYNVNGHGANGTAPNTPKYVDPGNGSTSPYLNPNAKCTDCHDISIPSSGQGRHLNGILNSVELKQNRSENTAHLRTDTACPPPYSGVCYPFIDNAGAGGDANVQVNFDRACWLNCHVKLSPALNNMRHGKDLVLAPAVGHTTNFNNFPNAARFGDYSSVADGESVIYPIDSALTTLANTAPDDFAPCISCHNPHGTSTVQTGKTTNRMVRAPWEGQGTTFCLVCHP